MIHRAGGQGTLGEATSRGGERRLCWADALRLRERLSTVERQVLSLLAWLPLAPASTLEAFTRTGSLASFYRRLADLGESGLIDWVMPRIQAGRSPRLFYLIDLGLAVVSLNWQADLATVAHGWRLTPENLLARLVGITHLVALYDLLGHVARAGPSMPVLLSWQCPWSARYYRPTAKAPITLTLPARATLTWSDGGCADYLLLPDRGALPLNAYWSTLSRLLQWREARGGSCPSLVVATTTPERVVAWRNVLEAVRDSRGAQPLGVHVATWEGLRAGEIRLPTATSGVRTENEPGRPERHCEVVLQPGRALPRFVGGSLEQTRPAEVNPNALGQVALALSPREREMLLLVSRHPFLDVKEIGVVLGWNQERVRDRVRVLIRRGFLRFVGSDEVDADLAQRRPVEASLDGLRLVAAEAGVTIAQAVSWLGLAGGGPESPVGSRCGLIRAFAHTLGVNAVVVSFYRAARDEAGSGGDDTVIVWRGAAECARGRVRPDAYLMYRRHEGIAGFFVEYDRGSMHRRDYAAKMNAYYDYLERGRFAREYLGYPVVLVVGADDCAEERFARAARFAALGRTVQLRVLLTAEWRIFRDLRNALGPLGQVWREPDSAVGSRFGPLKPT